MRFKLFQLSPRGQRRLRKFWTTTKWYLGYPLFIAGAVARQVGGWFALWWQQRNWRFLLQGLPALFVAGAVLSVGALAATHDRALLGIHYLAQAHRSSNEAELLVRGNKDATEPLAMAETCFHRLIGLQDSPENRFQLARVLELKKEPDAVMALMRRIAPPDQTGYGAAHLIQAEQILTSRDPSPEALVVAEMHLRRALLTKDVAPQAHHHLAMLYRARSLTNKAEEHIAEAAKVIPRCRLIQAEWSRAQGRAEEARAQARAAADALRRLLSFNPDNHEVRLQAATALVYSNEFEAAKEMIIEALPTVQLTPNNPWLPRFHGMLSGIAVATHDARQADPRSTAADRLAVLEEALAWNPVNGDVYQRLRDLAKVPGKEAEKAMAALRQQASTAGRSTYLGHLFLGMHAYEEKQYEEARYHWQKAFDAASGEPVIANNLAWIIAFTPPADPDKALNLIEAAVKKMPNAPQLRGTRGLILAKLGRHEEALPEMEKCIPVHSGDGQLFEQLADTCEKLKLPAMAAEYKRRHEEILAKKKAASRPAAAATGVPVAPDKPADPKPAGTATPPAKDVPTKDAPKP